MRRYNDVFRPKLPIVIEIKIYFFSYWNTTEYSSIKLDCTLQTALYAPE